LVIGLREIRRPVLSMSINRQRAKEIQAEIRQVLMRDWDPIGVCNEPNAQDEYDSYIGDISSLLVSRASQEEIAQYLLSVETEEMEYDPCENSARLPVARALLAIKFE
jgi:hypothetical protein